MKFLRFIGWLCVPYIMIGFRWNKISNAFRVFAILWSVVILTSYIGGTHKSNSTIYVTQVDNGNKSASKVAEQKKEVDTTKQNQPVTISKTVTQQDEKAQVEDEIKKIKENNEKLTPQQMLDLIKKWVKVDKDGMIKQLNTNAQDVGFAGNLFIQTNKNSIQKISYVGDQITYQKANGIYWSIPVVVDDAGNNPMTIDSSMFTLVDSDGRKFATDTKAELSLVNHKPILSQQLNPWVDVTGYLIFDMPPDVKPSDVILRIQNVFNYIDLKIS